MPPKEILKVENFPYIYDWSDGPGIVYKKHSHKGKVAIFITKGDVTFLFADGSTKMVSQGERFDVPVGLEHSAIVGDTGCTYIVGEMINGDS